MKNSRNQVHIAEKLKDRRAYRETLIQRQNQIERKIKITEGQIKYLMAGGDIKAEPK